MVEEPPQAQSRRPTWLTIGAAGAALSAVLYVFTIGNEIGTMRQQTLNQELRINALEEHGSGPVQTNAAKVEAVADRVDRLLTGYLALQQRVADLQAAVARLQQDADARKPPDTRQ